MTPDQWREELTAQLVTRRAAILQARVLYDGPQAWPSPPAAIRARMERLCALAETNICSLIVDSVADRLEVDGIRISIDQSGDDEIWRDVWQANHLDVDSTIAHEEALKSGRSFLLASQESNDEPARLTVEDPIECIVAYRPGDRRRRVAALKTFAEGDEAVAVLWTPETVYEWRADVSGNYTPGAWKLHQEAPHRFGRVPMVELRCKPKMNPNLTGSELPNSIVVIQQRINLTMLTLLLASGLMVVPQRYIVGADLPRDADGNLINLLEAGPDRAWVFEADDPSKFQIGQLEPANVGMISDLIENDIQRAAAMSRTPLYYLNGGLINISADTIQAAQDGQLAKVKNRQRAFGEVWEEGIDLVRIGSGMPSVPDMEVHWSDPETRSLAEKADAAAKLAAVGYPFPAIARKMGESQAEITRLMAERDAERAASPMAPDLTTAPAV